MTCTVLVFETHQEALGALAADLSAAPVDPFASIPVAVGNGALRRWLRHELATALGIAAGLDLPLLPEAIDAATAAALATEPAPWWPGVDALATDTHRDWRGGRLRDRVLQAFRAIEGPEAEPLRAYLWHGKRSDAVAWRELSLADEVAAVVERGCRERPADFVAWARDPGAAAPSGARPPEAWLAHVLAALDLGGSSPATERLALRSGAGCPLSGPPLRLVGPTTLQGGAREDLEALGRLTEVRWYRVVPAVRRWSSPAVRPPTNPLLANLGRAEASERQGLPPTWNVEVGPAAQGADHYLGAIQASVRADRALPAAAPDTSLGLHRTYGPLRQVEVLRDFLLRRFAHDRSLEPRDVLVLTPDLETYAPLVAAAFARKERAAATPEQLLGPAIPVRIANLGLTQTNPVADALLRVLELAEERVTATRLFELLSTTPVKTRFGLSDDDASDLRTLLVESNLRWGLDADDREAAEQPGLFQNTVEFGLQRLALGVLLPDEGRAGAVTDSAGQNPVVPMAVEGRARLARVAALAALVGSLHALRTELQTARGTAAWDAATWRLRIGDVLDTFTATSGAAGWLRVEVDQALDEALPQVAGARMELGAVRRLLAGRFELGRSGGRVPTGAVTVARLTAHATTPARVVALLGMDDAAFPRSPTPRAWDPFRQEDADLDARTVQRQALLDVFMATSDALFIAWSGFELRKGAELPPCVPVDELVQDLAAAAGVSAESLVRDEPRQPWSPRAFDAADPGFDGQSLAGARSLAAARSLTDTIPAGLGASRHGPELPAEAHPRVEVALDELAATLRNPAKEYVQGRLQLYLPGEEPPIDDREPLALNHLQGWAVRDEVLRLLRSGGQEGASTVEDLRARLAGRGELPLEAGGDQAFSEALKRVREALKCWDDIGSTTVLAEDDPAMTIRFDVGDVHLTGRPDRARRNSAGQLLLEWMMAGRVVEGRRPLTAWLHLLAACASAPDGAIAGARLRGVGGKDVDTFLAAPAAAHAASVLTDLAAIGQLARRRPLPLFENCSQALASKLPGDDDADVPSSGELAAALGDSWEGSDFVRGDLQDRHVAALWSDYDPRVDPHLASASDPPTDSLPDLAARVWAPLQRARLKDAAALDALTTWSNQ